MKVPTQKQQLNIVTFALRAGVWLFWLLFIAIDGIANSRTLDAGLYWMPWLGIGLLYAWVLDGWIRDGEGFRIVILLFAYVVLADFVQG